MKSIKVVSKNFRTLPGQIAGWWTLRGNPDLRHDLAEMFRRSASTGCTYHELGVLYQHIVSKKPRFVLELGCGVSTLVLAHAAKLVRDQGGECHVISMEEDSFYHEHLKSLLPDRIKPYVDVVLSPVKEEKIGDCFSRYYQDTPPHPYELVFVDGPKLPRQPNYLDGDILKVLDWNESSFDAYIDGRKSTRENLVRLLPYLKASVDPVHKFTHLVVPEKSRRVA
jgi:hypothetical protein